VAIPRRLLGAPGQLTSDVLNVIAFSLESKLPHGNSRIF